MNPCLLTYEEAGPQLGHQMELCRSVPPCLVINSVWSIIYAFVLFLPIIGCVVCRLVAPQHVTTNHVKTRRDDSVGTLWDSSEPISFQKGTPIAIISSKDVGV